MTTVEIGDQTSIVLLEVLPVSAADSLTLSESSDVNDPGHVLIVNSEIWYENGEIQLPQSG